MHLSDRILPPADIVPRVFPVCREGRCCSGDFRPVSYNAIASAQRGVYASDRKWARRNAAIGINPGRIIPACQSEVEHTGAVDDM
jgi:hypothetical protein